MILRADIVGIYVQCKTCGRQEATGWPSQLYGHVQYRLSGLSERPEARSTLAWRKREAVRLPGRQ